MGVSIRFRLFLSCFLLIATIAIVIDLSAPQGRIVRTLLQLGLGIAGAIVLTLIFSRSIDWRIQRLKIFADHVLDSTTLDEPLPEDSDQAALLNQSLRRMASRIRDLVE